MENLYSNRIPVISIVSTKSGAGKTTLIEGIIRDLKSKNYKVGILKHDVQKFQIDYPGKDSYRFTEAGADSVVIDSPSKLAMIQNIYREKSIDEILQLFNNENIIIVEGFKNNSYPKIEVHRKETDSSLLCKSPQFDYTNIIAVASDEVLDMDIPVLSIDDTFMISRFIENTFLKAKEVKGEDLCKMSRI
jgi:molybdopterin-guanine dinucleotide biosynthesis adapter protein